MTKQQFIDSTPETLGRPLTPSEIDSVRECACGEPYCKGWTFVLDISDADLGLVEA